MPKYKLSYRLDDDEGENKYAVTIFDDVENSKDKIGKIDNYDNYVESIYAPSWKAAREKAMEYLKELQKMPKDEIIEIDD